MLIRRMEASRPSRCIWLPAEIVPLVYLSTERTDVRTDPRTPCRGVAQAAMLPDWFPTVRACYGRQLQHRKFP